MVTKQGKTVYMYLVQYKKEHDLLRAFKGNLFQGLVKPRVAPLKE